MALKSRTKEVFSYDFSKHLSFDDTRYHHQLGIEKLSVDDQIGQFASFQAVKKTSSLYPRSESKLKNEIELVKINKLPETK